MIQEAGPPTRNPLAVCEPPSLNAEEEKWVLGREPPEKQAGTEAAEESGAQIEEAELSEWLSKAAIGKLEKEDTLKLSESFWVAARANVGKVLPEDLEREWRLGQTGRSERAMAIWIADSDIHQLAKLAHQMIAFAQEEIPSLNVLRLMAITAGLLGILRPVRAQNLLNLIMPHRERHAALLDWVSQAEPWAQAGLLLMEPEMKHRVLWNVRLRHPKLEWSWETPEAREALSDLPQAVSQAPPAVRALFQATVPNFWWDIFMERDLKSANRLGENQPGLWWDLLMQQEPKLAAQLQESVDAPGAATSGSRLLLAIATGGLIGAVLTFAWLEGVPPYLQPLRVSAVMAGAQAQEPVPKKPAENTSPRRATQSAMPGPPPTASEGLAAWRQERIEGIRKEFPALERLHLVLRSGTLAQADSILRGGSSIATAGSASYQALLKWTVLAPPADAEVRRAVIRLFCLTLPTRESFDLMELLAAAGEQHAEEFRQMASLMLSAGAGSLAEKEQLQLTRIAQSEAETAPEGGRD